jgi:hypothetical protein
MPHQPTATRERHVKAHSTVSLLILTDTAITTGRWRREPLFSSRGSHLLQRTVHWKSSVLSHETRYLPRHCPERNAVRATVNRSGRSGPTKCGLAPWSFVIHRISHGIYIPSDKKENFSLMLTPPLPRTEQSIFMRQSKA